MKVFSIILSCIFICSCSSFKRDDSVALDRLDKTISERQIYVDGFESRMDSLKRSLPAELEDSLLWEHAYQMYEIYRYYNIDTVKHYVSMMESLIEGSRRSDRDQISLTQGAKVRYMRSVTEEIDPIVAVFDAMDTTGVRKSTVRKWYSVGITLYMAAVEVAEAPELKERYIERLSKLREEYEAMFFDTSVHCRIMTAISYRDKGDLARAESILSPMLSDKELSEHQLSQVSYYLATVNKLMGRKDIYKELLINAAYRELRIPIRDYHSLYELALLLYQEKDFKNASRFISVVYSDANIINFYSRLHRASKAQNIIANSAYESEKMRLKITMNFVVILSITLVFLTALLFYSFRQRMKLRRLNKIVISINDKLEKVNGSLVKVNGELKDANMIKDNYVSRYMSLSAFYIRQVDQSRSELRRAGKSGGIDAVMALLRSPRYADEEYKKFCRIFDDTFMALYPDFVEKVNELLPEDCRYYRKPEKGLNTELRVLALIRLGVVKSQEIAQVLNCSVNTVYKYRETFRSKALCNNEDFEDIVRKIGF